MHHTHPRSRLTLFLVLLVSTLTISQAHAGMQLVEDWETAPALDASSGVADSNIYIENGELHQVVRPYSPNQALPCNARNRFANDIAADLTSAQATVRIDAIGNVAQTPEILYAAAGMGGIFYNTGLNPADATGDVFFIVRYGDRGNGLEVWWEIDVSTNSDFSEADEYATGSIGAPVDGWQIGTNYVMDFSYDGDRTFALSFNGTMTNAQGPERQADSYFKGKWIRARVWLQEPFAGDPDANMLHVVFDDVHVGLNLAAMAIYDDFDGTDAALSQTKWHKDELIRQATVTDNMLKTGIKGAAGDTISSSGIRTQIWLPREASAAKAMQVDMQMLDTSIPDGSRGMLQVGGVFGNGKYTADSYPENGDGEIFMTANVQKSHNPPYNITASCWASIQEIDPQDPNADPTYTDLFTENNSGPANLDTMYTAYLGKSGPRLFCEVRETATNTIVFSVSRDVTQDGIGQIYPVNEDRRLRVRNRNAPAEVIGYFDNLYAGEGRSSLLLNIIPVIMSTQQNSQ